MTTSPHRIAIVGGGIGGLLCARVLRRGGIDVTVLEREGSHGARDQGGTLDLRTGTGQAALATAGLLDAFTARARPEGQEFRQYSADGTLVEHSLPEPDDRSRPEIDRGDLRAILLDAVGVDTIRWNTTVTGVTPLPSGRARVDFGDGSGEDFDLVVGADGAWSRVRPAVSDAVPRDTGNTLVEAWFAEVDERHPELAELVGAGMMAAFDPDDHDKALIAQRNSDGRVRVYLGLRANADWAEEAGIDLTDADTAVAHLLSRFEGWAEPLRSLISEHHGGFVNRQIHVLPVPHRWDHVPGVTLLGDAAHLMPPAGEGANHALLDGAELATAVLGAAAAGRSLDDAVRNYEAVMFPRAAEAATRSAQALSVD